MSAATTLVAPISPLLITFFIVWILFPVLSLCAVLLLRNSRSISPHTIGAAALILGGIGLTINVGFIVVLVVSKTSGGLIGALDLIMILGVQFPTLYIGCSKLKEKQGH